MALAIASTALNVSNAVLEQIGEAPVASPEQSHSRIVNLWPSLVAGLSCLVVTISAVALGILGSMAVLFPLGIAVVGCGGLTIYLRDYSTVKDLDSYTRALAQQVSKISNIICRLSGENKKLVEIEKDFEAVTTVRRVLLERQKETEKSLVTSLKDRAESLEKALRDRELQAKKEQAERERSLNQLTQTNAELNQGVREREQLLSREKENAATTLSRLQELSAQLQQAQSVRLKMGRVLDNLHKMPDVESKIKRLASESAGASMSSEELAEFLPLIQNIKTEIQKSFASLQQPGKAPDERGKEADGLVVTICGVAENAIQKIKSGKEELGALKKQLAGRDRQLNEFSLRINLLLQQRTPGSPVVGGLLYAEKASLLSTDASGSLLTRPRSHSVVYREGEGRPTVRPASTLKP